MTILYTFLILLGLLVAILLINTLRTKQEKVDLPQAEPLNLDKDKLAQHLSGAIQIKTVSSATMEGVDQDAFFGFHAYLEKTYPKMHSTLSKETVNTYSLLYTWKAKNPTKKPLLMMAHMDVVPVEPATIEDWEHPPFSGEIADGYIWGRGTLDMKGQLISVCEAVEYAIANGFEPKRDIYLAFGHDEENSGLLGGKQIAELIKSRGIVPELVVDEGGAVVDGKMLGLSGMLGLIGIAEKGYADITLEATAKGGHASQPPVDTAVSEIAEAILLLRKHQLKRTMNVPLKGFLKALSPSMPFGMRLIISNLWLFEGLLLKVLGKGATSNALTRTTFAPTQLTGSPASNVLAQRATATINFRISPDDSVDKLIAHIEKVLEKTNVKIVHTLAHNPTQPSDITSDAYALVRDTIQQVMPDLRLAPYLMVAATDSRQYAGIAENIFQFCPYRSMAEDLGTIHATNERLEIESFAEGVTFFIRLLNNSNQ
ncbi:MAG: M20 family peptidase [Eubacteriales bacterium]